MAGSNDIDLEHHNEITVGKTAGKTYYLSVVKRETGRCLYVGAVCIGNIFITCTSIQVTMALNIRKHTLGAVCISASEHRAPFVLAAKLRLNFDI